MNFGTYVTTHTCKRYYTANELYIILTRRYAGLAHPGVGSGAVEAGMARLGDRPEWHTSNVLPKFTVDIALKLLTRSQHRSLPSGRFQLPSVSPTTLSLTDV